MNLSLLAKWRWRLLSEEDAVWINVIKAKYGVETTINTRLVEVGAVAMASPWWGDLCKMDKDGGWFANMAVKKLGRGNKIKFWKEVWVGKQSLQQRVFDTRDGRTEEWGMAVGVIMA
jgi:hypothetical protein